MRNNRTLRILSVLLIGLLFIGSIADAQTVEELREAMDKAEEVVEKKKADHDFVTAHLNKQIANFVRLHGHLANIKLPKGAPATNTQKLIVSFAKVVTVITNANHLTDAMQKQLDAIERQREKCDTRWADVVLAQTAYEDAVDAFNAKVSPSEQVKTVEVPQADPVSNLYLCPGPCSTPFTTKVLATTSHKVFCQEPPHKGTNKYSYYSCPPDYENLCPARSAHQTPCHGGCGTLFAQNTGTLPRPDSVHIKQCDERTSRNIFNLWTGNCIGYYYNCNGQTSADCNNAKQHIKEDSSSSKSASLSGSSTAKAGSTYRIDLTTPSPYRYMYWYVRDPGQSGRGRLVRSVSGSRRSYTASLSYAFPSSASAGDYVITALVRSVDGSESEVSHTVRVESSSVVQRQTRVVKKNVTPVSKPTDTTTKEKETPSTSTTQKKTNPPLTTPTEEEKQPPPEQPKQGACGHSYVSSDAASHALVSCPQQNGVSCSYGSYYKCKPHQHAYPSPQSKRPTATCSAGHTYNPNSRYGRTRHKDRTCTRCSLTYQNCTNHASACQNSKWHTEDPSAAPKPKTTTTNTNNNNGNSNNNNGGNSNSNNNGNSNNNNNGGNQNTAPPAPSKPTPTYHACGIHLSSVSGDHSRQASCSQTNSNGDRCTVTNFYACQSHTHQYPDPPPPKKPDPPPPPKSACPADSWSKCGGSTSHASTCSAGHSYYTCASQAWHKDRTCTRCGQTYQDCTNSASACQSNHWHTDKAIAKIKCGASGWTSCTTSVSSKTEHRRTCRENHQYWTCGTAVEWHKTRTCTRCGWAYSNCGNSATACQGKRWHTGG